MRIFCTKKRTACVHRAFNFLLNNIFRCLHFVHILVFCLWYGNNKIIGIGLFHKGKADNSTAPIWNKKVQYPWQDKAGGYGIQDPFGAMAVKWIKGDYYNVVGLPVSRLYQVLKEIGVEL